MANIQIKTINYITSGEKQKYINVDLEYRPEDYDFYVLSKEGEDNIILGENNIGIQTYSTSADYYKSLYYNNRYSNNHVFAISLQKNNQMEDDESVSDTLFSIKDSTNNVVIHNLFDIKDLCIQSSSKVINKSSGLLYAPNIDVNLLGITQLENYTYCLTNKTKNGFNYQSTNLQTIKDNTTDVTQIYDTYYNYKIISEEQKTYLYDTSAMNEDAYDISDEDTFQISCNLSGIYYNYVLELQNESLYNDYEEGDVLGDVIVGKNMYDTSYSMRMDTYDTLKNCREYSDIGVCGNELFLTYSDDIDYKRSSNQKDKTRYNILMEEDDSNVYTDNKNHKYPYKYQKVERIGSINRFSSSAKHRSNMFSIKINNTGLNLINDSDEQLGDLKKKIKFDIETNIRDLVKKFAPVTTQLLSVEMN